MRHVLLFIFLFMQVIGYSKQDSAKRWRMGLFIAPELCNVYYVTDDYYQKIVLQRNKKDFALRLSYNGGITFSRYLYKGFSLETGVFYNDRGYLKPKSPRRDAWDNIVVYYKYPTTVAAESEEHICYLTFPFCLKYNYNFSDKISFYLRAGASIDLRKQQLWITKEYQPDGSHFTDTLNYMIEPNKNFYDRIFRNEIYSATGGVGVSYHVPYNMYASAELYTQYSSKYNYGFFVRTYQYSYGLGFRLEKAF